MDLDNMAPTIEVSKDTRDRLKSYGKRGDTYDDIIGRMMDIVDREMYLSDVCRRLEEKEKFTPLENLGGADSKYGTPEQLKAQAEELRKEYR